MDIYRLRCDRGGGHHRGDICFAQEALAVLWKDQGEGESEEQAPLLFRDDRYLLLDTMLLKERRSGFAIDGATGNFGRKVCPYRDSFAVSDRPSSL